MSAPFGFINAFKPPGPSSAAFGNWVKHLSEGAAVGHWGTLDPRASGVLVLGVGKATRLFPLIADSRKQYVFELIVGEQTDSGDGAGQVIARAQVPDDWKQRLPSVAASLVGPQTQLPPMHSAVKVEGKPLYRSARAGVTVPRAPRATTIEELRVLPDALGACTARLYVRCDAGTYVRVLCEDLGRRLGLPARMGALLRVASGPFALRESIVPTRIAVDFAACLIDPLSVLHNPRVELDEVGARRFNAGNELRLTETNLVLGDRVGGDCQVAQNSNALVTHEGALIGIGQVFTRDARTILAPIRVLATL